MGLTDKLTEKRKAKLIEYLKQNLPEAGEVEASLPMVQTANPMFRGSKFFGITVTPGGTFEVEVPRIHREDEEAVVAALGAAPG